MGSPTGLTIANWNILYEMPRPSDKSRFQMNGKPTMAESKTASAALAFFCYDDNISASDPNDPVMPNERQLVTQKIGGKDYTYYRGGSNAQVRMVEVEEVIQALTTRAKIVCLQEVTEKMHLYLEKIYKATHQILYSFEPGNNHGVMMLVNKDLVVVASHEVSIEKDDLTRRVAVVDVIDPTTGKIIRVAAAHLYGHFGPHQAVYQESSDLFSQLQNLSGEYDHRVVCADINESKKARDFVSTSAVHYADVSKEAGWQLHLVGRVKQEGLIPVQAKPPQFALCGIMLDQEYPSVPLDLSDLPQGLSDHAPIGTTINFPPFAKTAAPLAKTAAGKAAISAPLTETAAPKAPVSAPLAETAAPKTAKSAAAPITPAPLTPAPTTPSPVHVAPIAPVSASSTAQPSPLARLFALCSQIWAKIAILFVQFREWISSVYSTSTKP